jgi:P pilus assembly chaperone PapD
MRIKTYDGQVIKLQPPYDSGFLKIQITNRTEEHITIAHVLLTKKQTKKLKKAIAKKLKS